MTRFNFGLNWQDYLQTVDASDIQAATDALTRFLGMSTLEGRRFLDIGCGSGLHSLAALRLGASEIVSLDYDPHCIAATQKLREQAGNPDSWHIRQADILSDPVGSPHTFDIVYAWGSLHHTGHLWEAIEKSFYYVAPRGFFFVALYNKHWTSPLWRIIKRLYCSMPPLIQDRWVLLYAFWETLKAGIRGREPLDSMSRTRGMKWRCDLRDWLGGYPYEYASREEVVSYMRRRGFELVKEVLNSGTGCSEYLFHESPTT